MKLIFKVKNEINGKNNGNVSLIFNQWTCIARYIDLGSVFVEEFDTITSWPSGLWRSVLLRGSCAPV